MSDSSRITGPPTVLSVVSDAGSSGKTTSATSLAALLAEDGVRVLLVDLDPQANATRTVGLDPDDTVHTAGAVMLREATLAEAAVPTTIANLSAIPSGKPLGPQRVALTGVTAAEQRLKLALRSEATIADVVILDCQAGVGEFYPLSALIASTSVLTVTYATSKELEGVPRVEEVVTEIAEAYNPGLRLDGVIPCAVPPATSGRLYAEALAALIDAYNGLVTPAVRRSVVAARAYDVRSPLPVYAPDEPVTNDYRAVLTHLRQRGVL
ncbi:MAG: ParA family protein [Dermatophilaceae bacterium]